MELKLFLSVILFFSSWVSLTNSQGTLSPCIQKLLPCQPYLKSSSTPPPACCLPLKETITEDSKCLCDVFNNPDVLKSLNITQDVALKLPKACGTEADTSVCKSGATPPTNSPSAPSNDSPTGKKTSSACGISNFSGYGFLVLVSSLLIPAIF